MTVIYRGKDLPVWIGNPFGGGGVRFVQRAQSFQVTREQSVDVVTEPGPGYEWVCGEIIGMPQYRAVLEIYEVGQGILGALGFISDALSYLRDDANGPTLSCSVGGVTNAQITGITWTATADGGARCRIDVVGQGWVIYAKATPFVDFTRPGAYHAEYCYAYVGTGIKATVQRATIQVQMPCQFIYELHAGTTAVGRIRPSVQIGATIETIAPNLPGWISTPDNAQNVELVINDTRITIQKCVSSQSITTGSVRGWGTMVYSYISTTNVVPV